jgi:hypothetical protein
MRGDVAARENLCKRRGSVRPVAVDGFDPVEPHLAIVTEPNALSNDDDADPAFALRRSGRRTRRRKKSQAITSNPTARQSIGTNTPLLD